MRHMRPLMICMSGGNIHTALVHMNTDEHVTTAGAAFYFRNIDHFCDLGFRTHLVDWLGTGNSGAVSG